MIWEEINVGKISFMQSKIAYSFVYLIFEECSGSEEVIGGWRLGKVNRAAQPDWNLEVLEVLSLV